jgi:hypothetical protein
MSVYTYADVQQHCERVFDDAKTSNDVMIQSPDGDVFLLRLVTTHHRTSSLPHLDIHLSRQEIVDYIREARER